MQLFIDPPRAFDRCKFALIPPALGRSMQICIDPLGTCGIDANLHRWIDANFHRSPQGLRDRRKFASIPSALVGSMQICIDPPREGGSMQIFIDPPRA